MVAPGTERLPVAGLRAVAVSVAMVKAGMILAIMEVQRMINRLKRRIWECLR